jgi:hypothetical protein
MSFECDECGREFESQQGLNSHRGHAHLNGNDINLSREEIVRLYLEEELTLYEIAKLKDCDPSTIQNVLEECDIERRDAGEYNRKDYDLGEGGLRRLYLVEELSTREIAELKGCDSKIVSSRLEEHGIPARKGNLHASYYTGSDGYRVFKGKCYGEKYEFVYAHQLLACIDHDPHEVFAENTHVHHGADKHGEIPPVELRWANWEGNLEVMDGSEHVRYHKLNPRLKPDTANESGTKSILEVI